MLTILQNWYGSESNTSHAVGHHIFMQALHQQIPSYKKTDGWVVAILEPAFAERAEGRHRVRVRFALSR